MDVNVSTMDVTVSEDNINVSVSRNVITLARMDTSQTEATSMCVRCCTGKMNPVLRPP